MCVCVCVCVCVFKKNFKTCYVHIDVWNTPFLLRYIELKKKKELDLLLFLFS